MDRIGYKILRYEVRQCSFGKTPNIMMNMIDFDPLKCLANLEYGQITNLYKLLLKKENPGSTIKTLTTSTLVALCQWFHRDRKRQGVRRYCFNSDRGLQGSATTPGSQCLSQEYRYETEREREVKMKVIYNLCIYKDLPNQEVTYESIGILRIRKVIYKLQFLIYDTIENVTATIFF